MKSHKLSGANWSVSNKVEDASYYTGNADNPSYSTSGRWVNSNVFASLPKSYTACDGAPASSSAAASSSSYVQPAGTTDYIDDLEDGDNYTFTGGEWYAYTDDGDLGASTITNGEGARGGYEVVFAGSKAGNSTKYVAGITGIKLSQGDNLYDPYVALGLSLNEKQTAYDLSACKQITYKYKGAAHNFKAEDTEVMDYGYHQIRKSASSTWTTVTIPWNMLTQEAWPEPVDLSQKRINKLTWEVKGNQPTLDYLYVDDVRCTGMAIALPASSSSSVRSSSSGTRSSSSVARSSSSVVASSSSLELSSSSIEPSSSSIASSCSAASSSSAVSSSSAALAVVVSGDLEQVVAQSGKLEAITFKNAKDYTRTWNLYFLDVESNNLGLVVSGTVPKEFAAGTYTETFTINTQEYKLNLTVVSAESSFSEASSSSAEPTSSSMGTTGVVAQNMSSLMFSIEGRMLNVGGAEWANIDVLDMQGRPVANFKQVKGPVSLDMLRQGNYIVRVNAGSNSLIRQISIK